MKHQNVSITSEIEIFKSDDDKHTHNRQAGSGSKTKWNIDPQLIFICMERGIYSKYFLELWKLYCKLLKSEQLIK